MAALVVLGSEGMMLGAQDLPSGMVVTLDVSQRLEYSDNPDFEVSGSTDGFARTTLDLGLDSTTRLQRFRFNLGGDLELGRGRGADLQGANPFAELSYARSSRNASLGFDASFRERNDISGLRDEEFDLDSELITQNRVTRQFISYGFEGAVGREAPVGANLVWRYNEANYSGATTLTDQNSSDLRGQIDFRVNPAMTLNLTARASEVDTEGNGVNRETTGFGFGGVMRLSQVLSANAALSHDRIERSGTETGVDEGESLQLGLERALANGSWGLSFSSDVASNDDSRRSQLNANRQMELARGNLSYSLGLTGTEELGYDPLASFDYVRRMPTAQLGLGMSQRVVTDTNNNEQINISLRASFEQEINEMSSFGASLSIFAVNRLSGTGNNAERFDLGFTYRHALTRDWDILGGITHVRSREDTVPDRRSNTIFVGMERSFSWYP